MPRSFPPGRQEGPGPTVVGSGSRTAHPPITARRGMMSDRPKAGIELNSVQVVASMAAAGTGAILTSYLGAGGGILGTAVGSGASTAGFAVYKHYLVRTKEKVAPVIVEHARQWTPTGSVPSDQPAPQTQTAGRAGGPAVADAT